MNPLNSRIHSMELKDYAVSLPPGGYRVKVNPFNGIESGLEL